MISFFRPVRPLLLGWLLSFLAWGLVGVVVAAYGVSQRGDAWNMHLVPGLHFWLPWAVWTPLLFRVVSRCPIDRRHWPWRLSVHLVVCVVVVVGIHLLRQQAFRSFEPRGWDGPPPALREGFPADFREGPPTPPEDWVAGRPPPASSTMDTGPSAPAGERLLATSNADREPPPIPRSMELRRPGDDASGPPLGPPRPRRIDLARMIGAELPTYLAIVTGAHALFFFRRDQERSASLARARLDTLRMQLQPHFLFNTLNTIGGLIHEDPKKADALVNALGDLLRRSLETSSDPETTLHREVDFAERYLELMHARFEERLRYEIHIAPEVRGARVPTMLLHPLVENAVEHGIQPKPEGGRVILRAWRERQRLHLAVIDDGVGLKPGETPKEGIGLGNTRTRLEELYGPEARFSLRTNHETRVEIVLPFRTENTPA